MDPVRVGHFIRDFVSPTETFVTNQIKFLSLGRKFEPVIFCKTSRENIADSDFQPTVLGNLLNPLSRKIDDLQYRYLRRLSRSGARAILGKIRSDDVRILHFHYLVDARYYLEVIKKAGVPAVVSGYGWDVSYFPRSFKGLGSYYLKPLIKYMDFILAMSKDMKKDLLTIGCPDNKIIVHYHGIDTRRFDYPQRSYDREEPLTVLFCGRLTPKKGPHILLKALKHIREKELSHCPFRARLVGGGPMRERLEGLVLKNKLEDIVDLAGYIPHNDPRLLAEYREADIFVLPSLIVRDTRTGNFDKEGIPGTLIEALASGLPAVSTYHAGIPEVIETNRNGLLVNEGDEEELAHRIADLLNDKNLRERLGRTARESARKLDVRTKTGELEDIYGRAMSQKQSEGTL